MTDILFGQAYYLRFDPKLYAAMKPYPPLGTLYAASYLRARVRGRVVRRDARGIRKRMDARAGALSTARRGFV